MKETFLEQTYKKLIVSCQALEDEPLFSPDIMSSMAVAAMRGGAAAIRANSIEDISAIRKSVKLPMIGIIKKNYPGSNVVITPTEAEVDALVEIGVEVIALDATNRKRPNGETVHNWFLGIRNKYPDKVFMADCSTYQECVQAQELGFDIVGTTLCGYTQETHGVALPNMQLLRDLGSTLCIPIIAEGGIWTPEQLVEILNIPSIHSAVVGTAITRPMEITRRFTQLLASELSIRH